MDMRAAGRWVRAGGRAALDLLLPPHCPACDTPVDRQGALCAACFGRINFISRPFCDCCGIPFAHLGQAGLGAAAAGPRCATCLESPPHYRHARGALRYDAASSRLILGFKYSDRVELAALLAAHMARAGASLLEQADLLVPVPLHRARLRQRRYNQAALLARALARRADRPVLVDALRRPRATPPLGDLSQSARAAALAGAFAVRESRRATLAGRRILLIDDVMTSGATANECAATLLAAGAAAVDVLAAARVPDPRLG